jgi:CubicO group peptidase (beta-lactamase class C family)
VASNIFTTSAIDLSQFGIDQGRLERVYTRISEDIAASKYPGAAVAMARRGQVVAERSFGIARIEDGESAAQPATNETLWLLYSQTKPITSCAIWLLAERGLLNLHRPVASYMPDFAQLGKQDITAFHLLTHQAGFPTANVSEEVWKDHSLLSKAVCAFDLEYQPGSKVFYHSYAAHWVQAALIEVITGQDFRQFIAEEVLAPLGLKNIFVGVPSSEHRRLAGSYQCSSNNEHIRCPEFDNTDFYQSGVPGAGGYATAGAVAMFYQMLLGLGELNGKRLLSPRMVQYVTTNQTGDRPDEFFGAPTHRALGVHLRGNTPAIRGLSSIAHPDTFGHGGVGTSYSFADPHSGVSFTYLTNSRLSEPGHSERLEEIMTMAQAAVIEI